MEFGKIIFGIIGLCLFSGYADAAITAWTNPVITAAADGSAAATGSFAESLPTTSSTGITLAATTGATSVTGYSLTTATVGGATFAIDSASGLLTFSTGTLDFETNPTLVIVAEAVDDATPPATGTATVTLSVTNVNEAPAFASTFIGAVAYDGNAAGTSITTVTATDPESQTVVGYTIASGDATSDFSIVSTTGAISVATGKTLASATTSAYNLVIEANDGQTPALTGTTTLAIVVTSACSGVAALTVSMVTVLVAALVAFLK